MKSSELRAWADQNKRPDLFLHADCIAEREKLDQCGDDLNELRDKPLPEWLQNKIYVMWLYLKTGHWNHGEFPCDGVFAEVDRIKSAVTLVEGGDEVAAVALWE